MGVRWKNSFDSRLNSSRISQVFSFDSRLNSSRISQVFSYDSRLYSSRISQVFSVLASERVHGLEWNRHA